MVDLSAIPLSESVVTSGGTLCWMSPELLDPPRFRTTGHPSRESDCYALGMVIYEVGRLHSSWWPFIHPSQVLTGLRPFHHLCGYAPLPAVLRGERPGKPVDAESLGFSHALWGLMQLCWSESISTRPTAQRVLDYLSPASLTWISPQVYPIAGIGAFDIADSHSLSSWRISLADLAGEV